MELRFALTCRELARWVVAGGWRNVCVTGQDGRRRSDVCLRMRDALPATVRVTSAAKANAMHDLVVTLDGSGATGLGAGSQVIVWEGP